MMKTSYATLAIVLPTILAVSPGRAQAPRSVVPSFAPDEWLTSSSTIEFRVTGYTGEGGDLAAFVGNMDVSALLEHDGELFRYNPSVVRLPAGELELIVYDRSAGNWSEIGRVPLRVLTPQGYERVAWDPRLAIDNAGQLAEGHSIDQLAPGRETYQDFTFRAGLETQHVRPGFTVRSQVNTVGATNRQQALRFGTEQDDAPKFDLADYIVSANVDWATLSLGHVSAGTNRNLINGFSSRGVALDVRASQLSAKLAATNGSSIVGWGNPLGLGESGHRVLSGEIGVDAFAGRPGGLRVNATFVDGSVLPINGFNQGAILDAETSRGMGLEITASDPSGRVRFNGGYARSQYDDTEDLTLTRGENLVIIHDETRNARHLDLALDLLRGLKLSESTVATLSTSVRHERVDPLYRSVAAFTQSDLQENAFDVTASVGPISARYGHSRRNDNLDEIPSILTTLSRTNQVSVAMPLGFVVGSASSPWLPQLSYTLNRVHQFGEGVPENSGFSASHVPDQLTSVQGVSAQWFHSIWQFAYQLDRSTQDNRQEGRENADFERTAQTVTLGVNPLSFMNLSVDGSTEEAVNSGSDEVSRTSRFGLNANIRVASRTALTLFGSQSWSSDAFDDGAERIVRQIRLELSQGVTFLNRGGSATTGQFFIRFAHQRGDLFGLSTGDTPVSWTVNAGFNLSLF